MNKISISVAIPGAYLAPVAITYILNCGSFMTAYHNVVWYYFGGR